MMLPGHYRPPLRSVRVSQFMSNKYRKYSAALKGELIEKDRPCKQCDYNLRGLKIGGVCPECGTTIILDNPFRDSLCDAPRGVILRLSAGFWMTLGALAILIAMPFMIVSLRSSMNMMIYAVETIAAGLWLLGIWFITTPINTPNGVKFNFARGSMMRIAARWMQLPWLLLILLEIGVALTTPRFGAGPLTQVESMLFLPLFVLGLTGFVVLGLLLMNLAHWSNDMSAHRMLNWAVWGLPISTLAMMLSGVNVVFGLLTCTMTLLWLFSIFCFGRAMLSLGSSVTWAVHHSRQIAERDMRLRRRSVGEPEEDEP